jgi:hypothetical protein
LGELLRRRCDAVKERNARRATLRSIANQAAQRGRRGKAERIRRNNLGTVKKHRQRRRWEQRVRTVTYRAVNAVVDKATMIVVWHADHAAAINILDRATDADIGLYTPHRRVKQIIQERADRQRSRLPDQGSNTTDHCRCGERNIQSRSTPIKE